MRIWIFCLCLLATIFPASPVQTNVHQSPRDNESFRNYSDQEKETSAKVSFHVWYDPDPTSSNMGNLKFVTQVKPNTRLWRVIKRAARTHSGFRLRYSQYPFGKYVTSIGGIREDPSKNLHWMLYKLNQQPDSQHPPNSTHMHPQGVDSVRVQPDEIYLFWRNHASH